VNLGWDGTRRAKTDQGAIRVQLLGFRLDLYLRAPFREPFQHHGDGQKDSQASALFLRYLRGQDLAPACYPTPGHERGNGKEVWVRGVRPACTCTQVRISGEGPQLPYLLGSPRDRSALLVLLFLSASSSVELCLVHCSAQFLLVADGKRLMKPSNTAPLLVRHRPKRLLANGAEPALGSRWRLVLTRHSHSSACIWGK